MILLSIIYLYTINSFVGKLCRLYLWILSCITFSIHLIYHLSNSPSIYLHSLSIYIFIPFHLYICIYVYRIYSAKNSHLKLSFSLSISLSLFSLPLSPFFYWCSNPWKLIYIYPIVQSGAFNPFLRLRPVLLALQRLSWTPETSSFFFHRKKKYYYIYYYTRKKLKMRTIVLYGCY